EPALDPIPEKVWQLLKPGAPFLCSLYHRICLTEILLLAPFLVPRRALRRLEGVTHLPVDRFEVVLRSSRPSTVRRLFAPRFSFEGSWGIPCIVPPNYLASIVRLAGVLRPAWEDLDVRLNSRWPFRDLGSHTGYLFRARGELRAVWKNLESEDSWSSVVVLEPRRDKQKNELDVVGDV